MGELDTVTQIHIAVGVWTSFADGEVQLIELSKVIEVLAKNYPNFDKDEGQDVVQHWFHKFRSNFTQAEEDMVKMIQTCTRPSGLKESLIDLAQRIIVSDSELKDQEDAAIEKLQTWL